MRARLSVFCCFKLVLTAAVLSFVAGAASQAVAQSTAFTYQGSLDDGGAPASGLHDFRFRLFSVASGGTPIGSTLCMDNVSVVEGVFTVQLDFGQQFATTAQRHLEIEVRRDTGLTCGNVVGFVLMAPRQQITAAPMATHAKSAFALDAADGSPTNAVFVDNGGNVGVGTTSPAALFHLQGTNPAMILQDTASPSNQAGYISFWNSASAGTAWLGFGTPGSPLFSVRNARAGGDIELWASGERLRVTSAGNVGVGTSAPTAMLDVRGNIKLGSSGQYSALGGLEDLRLVRGDIDGDGTIIRGTGFTVNRVGEGAYDITFTPAFSGIPTITATAVVGTGQPRWATSAQAFLSASTARLIMIDGSALTDSDFSICVIGPR